MKLIFTTALLLLSLLALSQNRYYDAVELTRLLKENGGKFFPLPTPDCTPDSDSAGCRVSSILRKYAESDNSAYDPIALQYKRNNPFLKNLIKLSGDASVAGFASRSSQSIVGSVGGLNVTNFADGLARFLVKRMKEELNIVFFEAFERELDDQKDLQLLFPSTYSTLLLAKTEIYNYQRYLPALRQAFEYDLDEFLTNAYSWSVSEDSQLKLLDRIKSKPVILNVIRIVLYVARELDRGTHPGDILNTITNEPDIKFEAVFADLKSYLLTADYFSQSLRSSAEGRYWINRQEANAFRDTTFVRVYLGLMYQQCPEIKFSSANTLKGHLDELAKNMNRANAKVQQLSRDLASAEDAIKRIVDDPEHVKGSDYFTTAQAVLQTTEHVTELFKVDEDKLETLSFYVNHGGFLFANIESRAYSAAVFEAYTILEHAVGQEEKTDDGDAKKARDKALKIIGQFLKYGTFMASVAEAESSAEVADAIEAVALPTGSARIKREVAWNISLNAYMGVFRGQEKITVNGEEETETIVGIWAPVGIAVSRNVRLWNTNWSVTAFGSIIDVGALASYRLGENDQVERVPDITLENILAPGGYLIIGLPRIPISIGYGYQLTPQLRKVTSSSVQLNDHADRQSVFIAVDIPLINFWSRSRN